MKTKIPESHIDILESICFGHVATMRPDGMISVHPVSVMWDGNYVEFSTISSRKKVRNLEFDKRMTLSIPHPSNPVHYLELRGRGEVIADTDRKFVNNMAKKFLALDEYPYDREQDERVVIRLHIEQVSAPKMPS
tara:strand:+ start:453 stop:857 length:405 start_codon:yes stop_codon:yes gene_type:complete